MNRRRVINALLSVVLAMTAALLVSCSKEIIPNNGENGETGGVINFTAELGATTRAVTQTELQALRTDGFGVTLTKRWKDGGVSNETATTAYDSSEGLFAIAEYGKAHWQPQLGDMDVLAYDKSLKAEVKDGVPYLLVPVDTSALNDYVIATAQNRTKAQGAIPLTFRHIASLLNILAKADDETTEIKIISITLHKPKIAALQGYLLSEARWRYRTDIVDPLDLREDVELVSDARVLTDEYPEATSVAEYLAREEATGPNCTSTCLVIPTVEPQSMTLVWEVYDKATGSYRNRYTKTLGVTFIQGRLNLLRLNFTFDGNVGKVDFTVSLAGQGTDDLEDGEEEIEYSW